MVKKKGVKKRVKKNNSHNKRLLAISIGMFVVLGLMLGFVGNDSGAGASITGYSVWTDAANALTGKAGTDDAFIRWTAFGVFSVLLFSIFSSVKWPKGFFLRWMLAIPIAFVAVAMISKDFLSTALLSYGALGMTFITMIPLAIMFFFSAMLLQGKTSIGKIIFQFVGWYYYIAWTLYLLVSFVNTKYASTASWRGMIGLTGGSLSWTTFYNWWVGLFKAGGFPVLMILLSGLVAIIVVSTNKKFRTWIRGVGRELVEEIQHDMVVAGGGSSTN